MYQVGLIGVVEVVELTERVVVGGEVDGRGGTTAATAVGGRDSVLGDVSVSLREGKEGE